MEVRWTTYAAADLTAIHDHIAKDSLKYAAVVVERVLTRVHQLEAFPESGSIVPEFERSDIREIFVHSYRIIHQVLNSEVRILTVCHGANPISESTPANR